MIKKILIANRGEIALRIQKTCRKLNIETVGLYASDDAHLPHASSADTCIALGGGKLTQTYLNQNKIIEIAKEHGVDAIHPGYGFLSENTSFCEKVTAAGMKFIGPSPEAIQLMGDKITSKVKMQELGIPLIPGYHGDNQDPQHLASEADKIGYPVLIKASAGGGGKGMRIVKSAAEFQDQLAGAKREAANAFGKDEVLIEKYIAAPRHIEVQLVSDGQGNHFHFFERECSIQRRYQKVVEEAPAPNLPESVKLDMCATGVKIASGINYVGAGTIEYILAADDSFYFLEMNTRLQVEHPITELTTNRDLVELQILAAAGKAFTFTQSEIKQSGHAIECRIYAEDPDNDFLPTNGKIQKIEGFKKTDYRLDCGYRDHNSISTSYDPMLAKLIVWDIDRESSIEKMNFALSDVLFGGVKTNRDYLGRILNHPKFLQGKVNTHFLNNEADKLIKSPITYFEQVLTAAACLVFKASELQNVWDFNQQIECKEFIFEGKKNTIEVLFSNHEEVKLRVKGEDYHFHTSYVDTTGYIAMIYAGIQYDIYLFDYKKSGVKQVFFSQQEIIVEEQLKAMKKSGQLEMKAGSLQSPMPGKIFKILLNEGEKVVKNQPVLIVEAMKMEHTIKAPKEGMIKSIFFKEGDQVQGGVSLCEIE